MPGILAASGLELPESCAVTCSQTASRARPRWLPTYMAVQRTMTSDEASLWLNQVGATVYRNNRDPNGNRAWVVVVRAPGTGTQRGKLIMGFGASMVQATSAVEESWHQLLGQDATIH